MSLKSTLTTAVLTATLVGGGAVYVLGTGTGTASAAPVALQAAPTATAAPTALQAPPVAAAAPTVLTCPAAPSASAQAAPEAAAVAAPSGGLLNLNAATAEQLDALPVTGLGVARSHHITDYRKAHGPFTSTAQLADVPGLPADVAANLAAHVTV